MISGHRITTPGSIPDSLVFGASLAAMALIFSIAYFTIDIKLNVLYVFPLSAVIFHCARRWLGLIAFWLSLVLQAVGASSYHSHVAMFSDIVGAVSASVLTMYLASFARNNYLRTLDQATKDPLTGLANRRAFAAIVELEASRLNRYGGMFSIAMLDLDGFKKLNDTKGHQAGDEALKLFADILLDKTRQSDTIARIGGDEFVVLMPNTPSEISKSFANDLCAAVAERMAAAGFEITTSVGCKTYTTVSGSIDELLSEADALMYVAKQSGKNRVVSG